jgi:N6-adenosine-specific RNA methylase IME4
MSKYRRILADPPWRYGSPAALVGSGGKGKTPGIENVTQVNVEKQYPTMSLDEIKDLPVPEWCEDDAMLFMWVTNPFLVDGSGAEVVKAWGFRPHSLLTWAKTKKDDPSDPSMKTGWWLRSATEHLIIGVKGKNPRPAGYPALPTWFGHPRLPHSVKPDLHELVELTGPGPYLEMFARRGGRDNWDYWGNEAP